MAKTKEEMYTPQELANEKFKNNESIIKMFPGLPKDKVTPEIKGHYDKAMTEHTAGLAAYHKAASKASATPAAEKKPAAKAAPKAPAKAAAKPAAKAAAKPAAKAAPKKGK